MKNHLLLITDIFGETEDFKHFAQSMKNAYESVTTIAPYSSEQAPHLTALLNNEQAVYQYFIQSCGHDKYTAMCIQALHEYQQYGLKSKGDIKHKLTIVAFSAGASAMWRALSTKPFIEHAFSNIKQLFIGFYPSQIRHHTQLISSTPSLLIFPNSESHFEVDNVIAELTKNNVQKKHISVIKVPWLHGFFNSYSKHYREDACSISKVLIKQASTIDTTNQLVKSLTLALSEQQKKTAN